MGKLAHEFTYNRQTSNARIQRKTNRSIIHTVFFSQYFFWLIVHYYSFLFWNTDRMGSSPLSPLNHNHSSTECKEKVLSLNISQTYEKSGIFHPRTFPIYFFLLLARAAFAGEWFGGPSCTLASLAFDRLHFNRVRTASAFKRGLSANSFDLLMHLVHTSKSS